MEANGLTIDCVRRLAWLDGQELHLTRTEFDVVSCLVSHAPAVVPHHELADQAIVGKCEWWEASELLRRHICNIRQKMQRNAIRTVRGVGYAIGGGKL